MPSPRRTDPKEIIAEVQELSGDVERNLARIFELSDTLYTSVRHGHFRQERERLETDLRLLETRLDQATFRGESHDTLRSLQSAVDGINHQLETHKEIVPVYTMFANAWKRFAGSLHNGLRRASSVNRLVIQVHNKHGLAQQATPVTPTPQPPQTNGASVDDLVELYGEETLNG